MPENNQLPPHIVELIRPPPTFVDPHVTARIEVEADCGVSAHLGIHVLLCTHGHLHGQLVSSLTPEVATPLAYVNMSHMSMA